MTNRRESLGAADAASDEAKSKARIFQWKYTVEDGDEVQEKTLSLTIPRKFKRLKFTKMFASGDISSALELLFGAEAAEEIEEIEFDDREFELFMERLGEAIAGTSAKN